MQSGQAFDEVVGDRVDTSDHEGLAMTALWLVGGFVLATAALSVLDRQHSLHVTGKRWHPVQAMRFQIFAGDGQ